MATTGIIFSSSMRIYNPEIIKVQQAKIKKVTIDPGLTVSGSIQISKGIQCANEADEDELQEM